MPIDATQKGFHSTRLQTTFEADTFTGQYRHQHELSMRELVFTCLER